MFYVFVYVILVALSFSNDYAKVSFWASAIFSLHFATLWLFTRNELDDLKSFHSKNDSPLSELIPDDKDFPIPENVIPGTYGTLRDYGYTPETTHINFKAINPKDVKRIEAALCHINTMMGCGRSCYVLGDDGFTMFLVTRSGSRGALMITYIGMGESVTRSVCEIACVVISPKTETKQEQ